MRSLLVVGGCLLCAAAMACGDDPSGSVGGLGDPCYGNGTCDGDLTCVSDRCVDLGELCGNGDCDPGEDATSCPQDCAYCGNGTCDAGENAASCPTDCGPTCGNGICDAGENAASCPADCGTSCGNGTIDAGEVCDGADFGTDNCWAHGFELGELQCAVDCLSVDDSLCHDSQCGDDVTEGGEVCDGLDVGGQTCVGLGLPDGPLTCLADCSALDATGCNPCWDICNEWFACTQLQVGGQPLCPYILPSDEDVFVQDCLNTPDCTMLGLLLSGDCENDIATLRAASSAFDAACGP